MKQLILVILIAFLFTNNSFSQNRPGGEERFIIKFMPLSAIDFTPRYRFGVEYVAMENVAFSVDIGVGNTDINKWRLDGSKWGNDYTFYEIRPEVKYLWLNKKSFYLYTGLEIFYMKMEDYLENGHYDQEFTSTRVYYDRAVYNKEKFGAHIKGGINLIAGHFNFDFYLGIGVAQRTNTYSNVVLAPQGSVFPIYDFDWGFYKIEGTTVIPHLALGFKIGYSI